MSLFTPFALGPIQLDHRVVMAPMTRSRALGGVPNDLVRDYYAQRAPGGLLITEGTAPSPNGLGYARIPGLFSPEQVRGWRAVTDAVHAAGGRIVAQLMHVGRIGHPDNLPAGARLLAPSAVRAEGTMWTDASGPQPHPEPQAMSADEVRAAIQEFASAARNAREAGFDAVELHGANGYLLEQFLNPHTNRRTDEYGGDVARRARFVLEAVDAAAAAIGRDRVAIRLSPYNTFNDLPIYDETEAQYLELARALRGVLYVHLVQSRHAGYAAAEEGIRRAYGGPIVLNGGFDRDSAETAISQGRADLISFGRPYIANPDLVRRLREGSPLATPDHTTFYTPGATGYTDYPAL